MTTISKHDLQFAYSWTASGHDNPRLTGSPDAVLFNRREGYEVLDFINRFCAAHNVGGLPLNKTHALKAERMLQKVPGTVRSHANVTKWLLENWQAHA
jgi:hypothetical protein